MKLISRGFEYVSAREVQVKNDFTDNYNKHFVTAFEGACRNIIELREHLKLCFLIILARAAYSIECHHLPVTACYILRQVFGCWRLSVRLARLTIPRKI